MCPVVTFLYEPLCTFTRGWTKMHLDLFCWVKTASSVQSQLTARNDIACTRCIPYYPPVILGHVYAFQVWEFV